MTTAEGGLPFSMASVVADVLHQQGKRLCDNDLTSRKTEESSLRRYEAARWLRKMVGVVGGKDLPAEPSDEEFRLGLRSGIILCNVLNKIQPSAVPKVVEAPDSASVPDGAALSAFQYFENTRNFLVSVEEMGIPHFEASDLEQGGKTSRIVNCVLAMKSYYEWKAAGAHGLWRYNGNAKPSSGGKSFVRKNSEPFMRSLHSEKSLDSICSEQSMSSEPTNDYSEMINSSSLHMLVRELLGDRKAEEIPIIVENMLGKVMEEFEQRISSQNIQTKTYPRELDVVEPNRPLPEESPKEREKGDRASDIDSLEEVCSNKEDSCDEGSNDLILEEKMCKEDACDEGSRDLIQKQKMQKEDACDEGSKDLILKQKMHKEDARDDGSKDLILKEKMLVEQKHLKDLVLKEKMLVEQKHLNLKQKMLAERQRNLMLVEQQHRSIQDLKNTLNSAKSDVQFLQIKYQEEVKTLGTRLRGLAHAASGYQRVLEENRKLYNQVQDLKGSIRVYCRVRPLNPGHSNRAIAVDHLDEGSITLVTPSKNGKDAKKTFTFNRVFGPNASQEQVFSDMQPLIRSVLDGYNVCIFAYGQTGSGKTHTMSGPKELTKETVGVNYRALGDLFQISEQRNDAVAYEVSVQMLEIYNETVRDLLVTDGSNKRLEIRNNSPNGINVPDANLVRVSSTSDVINLMNLGQKNRAVSSTSMNDRSSRSHSCLTVHVQGRELTSGTIVRGSMHLVDLAGSERVDKSEVVGDRLKEAQHINKSLSALGDVISSLASKNAHVPYRNSKLTQLLQDSLGGQAKTLMFVHIAPEPDAVGESISTLKFAERVSTIELGAARVNKDGGEVKELKEQIASLKAALARKDAESVHSLQSTNSSPERQRLKSGGSSPSHSWQSPDGPSSRRQDDNSEVRSNPGSKLRRQNSDCQELYINSPPWPPVGSPAPSVDDDKESTTGSWVDKVMVNKQNGLGRDEEASPQTFYSRPDPSKVYPEQQMNKLSPKKDGNRLRYEMAADEPDDFDAATSDSSETDLHCQVNSIPKVSKIPNGLGSKSKMPEPKKVVHKASEIRSAIPAPSSRRLSNGGQKTGKPAGGIDVKRKKGTAK